MRPQQRDLARDRGGISALLGLVGIAIRIGEQQPAQVPVAEAVNPAFRHVHVP
jgi:hypothetical protein